MRRALLGALLCLGVGARGQPAQDGPLSPAEALASFQIEPGYRIELAAAEPLIRDPVAIAFDDRGRMFVVENRGYPDPLEGVPPRPVAEGVIALLEDTDRDGRFDKRSDFATNLTYPNGILPWDGGVFVTCAPDLLYLKDTNGDGVADVRRVALTGFAATRTAQIRFSHPTLGLDNWVYLTGGLNGGRVTAPDHPERPAVEFTNSDSRFNPVTLAFELTGGQGQYGLTFDDYGRRFVCSNRHPAMHVVLESRHLKRNPELAFSSTMQEVSKVGGEAVVWPLSPDMTTASFIPSLMSAPHAGTFTAASGLHIHRGDALPEGHAGSLFVCESAQNLVQRQVRSTNGVSFTSKPATPGRDFLSSRDPWFRPVFAANGPDGALYIVDMYRKVIDHPQYVPEGSRALLDFEAGKERGRIYRLAARDWKADRRPIDLGRAGTGDLVRTLEHANAWWRETSQRLLVERRDPGAIPALRGLASAGRGNVARIHALWALDGLGGLAPDDLIKALRDRDAAVRENAVRLAESRLATSDDVLTEVLRLATDANDRVRLQVALALGATRHRAIEALTAIASQDGAQSWVRAAVLSSLADRVGGFISSFLESPSASPATRTAVMQDLAQLFGAGEPPEQNLALILRIAESEPDAGWQLAALAGMAQGLRARGLGTESRSAFTTLLMSDAPEAARARERVRPLLQRAAATAVDDAASADVRSTAIALLGQTDYSTAGRSLESLLDPRQPADRQIAALRALLQLPEPEAAARLVEPRRWAAFTPQVREAALSILTTEERYVPVLLDAVERGAIAAIAIGPTRRTRMMNHRNAAIQTRARALFATAGSGNRMELYERLRKPVLELSGKAPSGQRIFENRCVACHAFNGGGGRLGPDLSGVRNQPADALLLHALVPDYEIAAGYDAYIVETKDGRSIFGRLEAEAPNSVTLRDAASQQHVILRSAVVSMSASKTSLMPNELERGLSEQDLADLIAYLKSVPAR